MFGKFNNAASNSSFNTERFFATANKNVFGLNQQNVNVPQQPILSNQSIFSTNTLNQRISNQPVNKSIFGTQNSNFVSRQHFPGFGVQTTSNSPLLNTAISVQANNYNNKQWQHSTASQYSSPRSYNDEQFQNRSIQPHLQTNRNVFNHSNLSPILSVNENHQNSFNSPFSRSNTSQNQIGSSTFEMQHTSDVNDSNKSFSSSLNSRNTVIQNVDYNRNYSKLQDLESNDITAFNNNSFKFENIPVSPPTREMCF